MQNAYYKGHGLGNDYVVFDPALERHVILPRRGNVQLAVPAAPRRGVV